VIIERLVADGWATAGVAQSDDTLAAIADRGATPLRANALVPEELAETFERARGELGDIDLIVNAIGVAAPRPPRALREAACVCRPGGRVAASLFAEPARSESSVV
jgi:NADP-dependent 3-hydroxy acid dehydrogenase YdfG